MTNSSQKRFAIGLSYPSDHQDKVKAIADILSNSFTKERILFNGYHEAEFARANLDTYLQKLFFQQTELIVVFLCRAFNVSYWNGVEWKAIRARYNNKGSEAVMLLKLDDEMPEGFLKKTDYALDISGMTPYVVAQLILDRYNRIQGITISDLPALNSYRELRDHLSEKLEQVRKKHPSFKLMEIDANLFPNGIPVLHSIEAVNDANETKTVSEIVADSWGRKERVQLMLEGEEGSRKPVEKHIEVKNHLMIEGEGGIGKTVTLLSLPDKFAPNRVPAVYVQLHELKGVKEDETVEDYIKEKYFSNEGALFHQFLALSNEPWKEGPRVLLLLDGFNEIAPGRRYTIGKDINRWADRNGVQIITSSRYDIHSYVPLGDGYSRILLQPLRRNTIEEYLNKEHIPLPTTESQWNVINHPLMLTLYAQTERAMANIDKQEGIQRFIPNNNAGSIIWNYLQREIWRYRENKADVIKCVLAAEFIAPYVAWKMQQNNWFYLDKRSFREYIRQGCEIAEGLEVEQFPKHIADILSEVDVAKPGEKEMLRFLKEELRLFVSRGDSFSLMHQQFRDALVAMHLINVVYTSAELPEEWKSPVDYYVMGFVDDLASEDEADILWEQNRTSKKKIDTATLNMLELQKRKRNYDFSGLDFSGMDLRDISLFPYRFPGTTNLLLPPDKSLNEALMLSDKTVHSEGHSDGVSLVTVTSDGRRCISGSNDSTIRIWDMYSEQCVRLLKGHDGPVISFAVTQDGRKCVSSSEDKTIRIWDLESGQCLNTFNQPQRNSVAYSILVFALSPDGKRLVSGSDDWTLCVWDMESGGWPIILPGHSGPVRTLVFTPDGNRYVSGANDGNVRIWEVGSNRCLNILKDFSILAITPDGRKWICRYPDSVTQFWDMDTGHSPEILKAPAGMTVLAITPNGKRIVGTRDGRLSVWDVESGNLLHALDKSSGSVSSLTVTPDGKRCVGVSMNTIKIWDMESGERLKILKGHTGAIKSLAITPDSCQCVSGSDDKSVRIWDLESGQCRLIFEGYRNNIRAIAITRDGEKCVCGSGDHCLRIWDLKARKCLWTLEGHTREINVIVITPDGKRCLSGSDDGTLRLWDMESGQCQDVIDEDDSPIKFLALTPDGKTIVSGSQDGALRMRAIDSVHSPHLFKGYSGSIKTLSITPDGLKCVCGYRDKTIRVWDLGQPQRPPKIMKGLSSPIRSLDITHDGESVVSATEDKKFQIWSIDSGDRLNCLDNDYSGGDFCRTFAISPDGQKCVYGVGDGHLLVWDVNLPNSSVPFVTQMDDILTLAITLDGKRCISGSRDNILRIWDMESGLCLQTLEGEKDRIVAYAFTPDRRHCLSASSEGGIYEWNLDTGHIESMKVLPLTLTGIDFSQSIVPDDLKETLRQNGAIV